MAFNYWADQLIWGKVKPMIVCPHVAAGEPQTHREILMCADGPELLEWCDRTECCDSHDLILLGVDLLNRVRARHKGSEADVELE